MTKTTSTTTARIEDEPDEDGIQNAREVIAGAREQIYIASKLVEAKMKTTAEPHVKEELNHMQAGVEQLQNDTAAVNGQKEFLADSQQVLGLTVKVKAVDVTSEWYVEAETQMQSKKLQRKWLAWICPTRHSPEEAIEPAPQQRTNHSQNEESPRTRKHIRNERATRGRASSKQ